MDWTHLYFQMADNIVTCRYNTIETLIMISDAGADPIATNKKYCPMLLSWDAPCVQNPVDECTNHGNCVSQGYDMCCDTPCGMKCRHSVMSQCKSSADVFISFDLNWNPLNWKHKVLSPYARYCHAAKIRPRTGAAWHSKNTHMKQVLNSCICLHASMKT